MAIYTPSYNELQNVTQTPAQHARTHANPYGDVMSFSVINGPTNILRCDECGQMVRDDQPEEEE